VEVVTSRGVHACSSGSSGLEALPGPFANDLLHPRDRLWSVHAGSLDIKLERQRWSIGPDGASSKDFPYSIRKLQSDRLTVSENTGVVV
jgi:hypothetical protein